MKEGFVTEDFYAAVPWGKKLVIIFNGEYQIRFTNGKIIYVYVKVRNGDDEKCHHQEAIEITKKEYPDLEVLRCYYC